MIGAWSFYSNTQITQKDAMPSNKIKKKIFFHYQNKAMYYLGSFRVNKKTSTLLWN